MDAETKRIYTKHNISNPVGVGGVTSGTATCSCGATWRVWYSRQGMEWEAQNDKCATHDEEMSKVPQDQW